MTCIVILLHIRHNLIQCMADVDLKKAASSKAQLEEREVKQPEGIETVSLQGGRKSYTIDKMLAVLQKYDELGGNKTKVVKEYTGTQVILAQTGTQPNAWKYSWDGR